MIPSTSDTSPHVQLHPLVILSISDQIARLKLRGGLYTDGDLEEVHGVIMGAMDGREITMEVAVEVKMLREGGEYKFDTAWLEERIEQCEWPKLHFFSLLRGRID